ncbi:hypothetical protein P692DRAFT_20881832 [Suillus brevipes Sb2]|nr:hypothetical protein P692DRAFT_20881832 [Suillus brevipes Sb2]
MSAISLLLTDLSRTSIGSWTIEQIQHLDIRYSAYHHAYKQGTLSTFWPAVFANFLNRWPVQKTLWPTMRDSHNLTAAELRVILDGEKYCKFCIQMFFNNRRTLGGRSLLPRHVGDWTLEQIDWLEDRRAWHTAARHDEEVLTTFWISLFDDFLSLWPVRQILWPTMDDNKRITISQQRFVFEAEGQCKLCLKSYFEQGDADEHS